MNYSSFKIEDHPFYDNFIPAECKFLIIGTFPTAKKKRMFEFFYASKTNLMWNVLLDVFGGKFICFSGDEAILERKSFLAKNSLGMTDMLLKCYRKDESSKDECLYPIIWNDIFSLLEIHKDIHTIILTSRTLVWGALGLLKTLFLQKNVYLGEIKRNANNILVGYFVYDKRVIHIKVPLSPSMRAHQDSNINYSDLRDMYRECFS